MYTIKIIHILLKGYHAIK